tara:strand:+ start:1488 stop:1994 length:507 start_codon:yes stop_codon:yes gene_type:complete
MKHIIVKGIGPDKPGIVANISGIVTSNSGNIEESRMIRLGSEFSIIMMIVIPDEHEASLSNDLESVPGIKFYLTHTNKVPNLNEPTHLLELTGGDTEGIVHKMTDVFTSMKINIIEISTNTKNAPVTGATVFEMKAWIDLDNCRENDLIEKIKFLESKLGLSIVLNTI